MGLYNYNTPAKVGVLVVVEIKIGVEMIIDCTGETFDIIFPPLSFKERFKLLFSKGPYQVISLDKKAVDTLKENVDNWIYANEEIVFKDIAEFGNDKY